MIFTSLQILTYPYLRPGGVAKRWRSWMIGVNDRDTLTHFISARIGSGNTVNYFDVYTHNALYAT